LVADGCNPDDGPELRKVVALLKERVATIKELADAAVYFYRSVEAPDALRRQHLSAEVRLPIVDLRGRLGALSWGREAINSAVKAVVAEHKLKLPKLAMPLRVIATGTAQTPSIDAVLDLIGQVEVLRRMDKALEHWPV
jgi:glutamyl-tRNA synthetase